MKIDIKDMLRSMPGMDPDGVQAFFDILDLPDAQFEMAYPLIREQTLQIYNGTEFQDLMLRQMRTMPIEDIEDEKQAATDIIDMITNDETLSPKKREFLREIFGAMIDTFEMLALSFRTNIEVKIVKLNPDAIIPQYAHPTDAGADVCAVEEITIEPGETKIVKTGIAVAIPAGYEIQVRPRSGLSLKSGLRIANAPGTIDADYRGEIGIIMTNTKDIPYVIDKGMKIAQLVIAPTPKIKWREVATIDELGETSRGAGGYGSTGERAVNAG